MNDSLLVRRFECVRDLLRHRQRLVDRNRAARDALRQIVALNEFHDEGGEVWSLFEAVDRGDVRMIEGREDFGFPLKAREAIRIACNRGGQHLDRHRTFEIAVGRAIDLAHAASTDLRDDFVDAEAGAGSQSQTAGSIAVSVAPTRSILCNGVVVRNLGAGPLSPAGRLVATTRQNSRSINEGGLRGSHRKHSGGRIIGLEPSQIERPGSPSLTCWRSSGRSPGFQSDAVWTTRYRRGPPSGRSLRVIGRGMQTNSVRISSLVSRTVA